MMVVVVLVLMLLPQSVVPGGSCLLTELNLAGDYLLGGLFQLHEVSVGFDAQESGRPEALTCHSLNFSAASYQQIQVMRFAVEKINNSSRLLPGVTLGYTILDYCHQRLSFSAALDLLAERRRGGGGGGGGGAVSMWDASVYHPRVISVTGPFGSSQTINVAPLFMSQLIPMVTHGASSVQLSNKARFPSFFRTIPSDINQVKAIVSLLKTFRWNWVAFIGGDNDYSRDALGVFTEEIRAADICLAYYDTITSDHAKMPALFQKLSMLNVKVVVLFANVEFAVPFLRTAAQRRVNGTVWIASETWSMNRDLLAELRRARLGTVLGIGVRGQTELEGLDDFILSGRARSACSPRGAGLSCNQACPACEEVAREALARKDPTYNVAIYAAVSAVAHALHRTLNCSRAGCPGDATAEPYMVTEALKQVRFQLDNTTVTFDQYGDPPAAYDIVYWNWMCGKPFIQTIGSFVTDRTPRFTIDADHIIWFDGTKTPPVLQCSRECLPGSRRVLTGFHSCCFQCQVCPEGTSVNSTDDPLQCVPCQEDEWARSNSTSCLKRSPRFLDASAPPAVVLVALACSVLLVSAATAALFLRHGDSPVVRSAGGRLCVFMLACLSLSSASVVLHVGPPSAAVCSLRYPVFLVCYGAVLSCLAVRSFQIVCIFKMAAKLPRAHAAWLRYGGQWGAVASCTCTLLFLCALWLAVGGPRPVRIALFSEVILDCDFGIAPLLCLPVLVVALLSAACFLFAYVGIDLPKNYNEGRSITFSLLLFFLACTVALTVNLASAGNHQAVNAGSVLISLYAILVGYFLPKCYIIVLQPERNTAAYFQSAIQTYTLQTR